MFSSAVQPESVIVSCPGSDWSLRSCPWWLNARGQGDQLLLTPRNCGFHSGTVTIQCGEESVSISVRTCILPSFPRATSGLGAGALANLFPIGVAAFLLLISLVHMIGIPYGLGVLIPLAVAGCLILGPMPLLLGCVWGMFLRSGRAWLHSIIGIILGGMLSFLAYLFLHARIGAQPPNTFTLCTEVFLYSFVWVGAVAACTAGPRMLLPTIPVVLLATALVVIGLNSFVSEALSENPSPQAANALRPQGNQSALAIIDMLSSIPRLVERTASIVSAAICVQLVFAASLPLLMMLLFPIPQSVGSESDTTRPNVSKS